MLVRRLIALGLFALLPVAGAFAQEQDPQPGQALPDIAPRVVEIRGALEISLPSLQRQPLVGFNPPPRVAPVPPERRPYVEEYKQPKSELPESPLSPPEPPAVAGLNNLPPRNGAFETSAGRYLTRAVHGRIESPLAPSTTATLRVDYRGTDGHAPFEGAVEGRSSFDVLDGRGGIRTTGRYATFGADVDGFFNRYPLYGIRPTSPALADRPERVGGGLGLNLWVRPRGEAPVDGELRLRLSGADYETDAVAEPDRDATGFARNERRLTAEGDLALPVGPRSEARIDATFSTAGLDAEGLVGSTVRSFDGAAGGYFRHGRLLDVALGARLLSFDGGVQDLGLPYDVAKSGIYVSPDVRVNLYPARALTVFVENRPGVDLNTLSGLYRENPYLVDEPRVLPTVRTVDAAAGLHVFLGLLELDVKAGYVRSPNYLVFERATSREAGGYAGGVSRAAYERAAIMHVGADLSLALPAGFNASVGATLRDGELLDDEAEIPYFGPLVGRGALSYSFLESRGFLQLTGTYEAARYRDRAQTRRIGDYFDLDALLTYNVTSSLGLVARLDNVSSGYLERWDGYEAAPYVFMGGFRVIW